MLNTIIVYSENRPGILYRIADLFLRRRVNIESLTVTEIEERKISRFTITVRGDRTLIEKIAKQIYRIIEVLKVIELQENEVLAREVALITVSSNSAEKRKEILDIAKVSNSKIISYSKSILVVEKCGTEKEIEDLRELLSSYGIIDIARTGRTAIPISNAKNYEINNLSVD
ncbi:MAG: acetolactate synthase small subunit [Patescibacteria group bacterium]